LRYRVDLTEEVERDIDAQVTQWRDAGVSGAVITGWLADLVERVDRLGVAPNAFPVAEIVSEVLGVPVRRLNFGEFVLFYEVDEVARVVRLLHLRHGRRRPWIGRATT